jgi:hypothetical protein
MQEEDTDERLLAELRLTRVFGQCTGRIILKHAEEFEEVFGSGAAQILSKIIDGTLPIE